MRTRDRTADTEGRLTDMELSVRRIEKWAIFRSVIDRESGTRCDPPGRISSKMHYNKR